jgi:hypothetical protein
MAGRASVPPEAGPGKRSRLMQDARRADLVAAIGSPCAYCGAVLARDHVRPGLGVVH